jgi:hypothetical protein
MLALAGSAAIRDDPAAANPATPLLSLRWKSVVITDAEPDRLAPLTPPVPIGSRGLGGDGAILRRQARADAEWRDFRYTRYCPPAPAASSGGVSFTILPLELEPSLHRL